MNRAETDCFGEHGTSSIGWDRSRQQRGKGPLGHLWTLSMSPGSVTEHLTFFTGTDTDDSRHGDGGGDGVEGEQVEVVELSLPDTMAAVADGTIVDAKTALLLTHSPPPDPRPRGPPQQHPPRPPPTLAPTRCWTDPATCASLVPHPERGTHTFDW